MTSCILGPCISSRQDLARALSSEVVELHLRIPLSEKIIHDFHGLRGKVVSFSPSVFGRCTPRALAILEEERSCSVVVHSRVVGRKRKLNENEIEIVWRLAENKHSIRKIAALFHVSRSCILRVIQHQGGASK